jgi:DNA-directed RNA polymerase subunit RPC12/RpoP
MNKVLCNRCKREFENDIYTDEEIENKHKEIICPKCREDAILDFLD